YSLIIYTKFQERIIEKRGAHIMKADQLYLGNVITMDEKKPYAQAVAVKNGLIQYVGSEDIARSLCDENTKIIDLKGNTIYPGFLEAHCHPLGAGKALDTDSVIDVSSGNNLEEYVEIITAFIENHPGKKIYSGQGFKERDVQPTGAMLDAISKEIPIMISSVDGHSLWLNSAAMNRFDINKTAVQEYGSDLVRVDEEGNPTGYISEAPVFTIRRKLTMDKETGMKSLLTSQNFFFSKGYIAVYDAGLELMDKKCPEFYMELEKENKLKLRTYAGSYIDENCEDIKGAVENIAKMQENNSEHFKVIGVKTFADGVVEAHTAYLLEDYLDQEGYKGAARMTEHEKLVELYTQAAIHNMNVHVHSVGDGAIHCHLDAIEEAIKATGKTDMRNALAHLQIVKKEDIQRFADLNVIAVVAPLWSPKDPVYFKQELEYVGSERAESAYPIKSFIDAGTTYAFHTDFPVSKIVGIPETVFTAVKRRYADGTEENVRASDEFITRYQALAGLTKNVAFMWHEDSRLGSLEVGKIANMAVFNKNFLSDDLDEIANASLVCTIVDGEIVYTQE
ncbi:MAG: amidohydrolase, partial [Firmicutes bacterium]|nr:amidohydrolase [Bacillota bacterium]